MEAGTFYREEKDGLALFVRLTPKARQDAAAGLFTQENGKCCLNIQLRAVPSNGEANKALIQFLSRSLNIAARDIALIRGHTARFKHLALRGDKQALAAKLAALAS
ncbi:MAG: DUF167 domain-containing protein [Candidatus Tokpelaia sp.]|uniref:DUF167 family protein n=1 Tax=Candidatus Tokpelaia sp. TaxID=2233777 RepID=UPI00123887C6|nr:DUF167 family protein [Candidatus Tokpelaia sp.]KAA6205261.1 MAG: DUF167 domain-containing protein [Candidatus Tokpelaia sp.]KAA6207487.1 MAG: DUF167 domain-containing protein [Candidatus Tokpelaia sp.]KAA6405238.1 DUF167 domain-containing protein [Candidatus Tokpelaia sp.]